jgi:hypothetical protein
MKNNYELNLNIIEKINKEFSNKLKKNESCENIEIINTKNFLLKQGAKEILAYNKDKEYETAKESINKIKLYNDDCTIMIGIGNGFTLYSLLKKAEKKHIILLIEPILQLLNYSFNNFDYSKYIENGNLIICSHKDELSLILGMIESQRVIQQWHTVIENYTVFLNQHYGELTKLSMDYINQILCNTGTVIGAGAIIAENDIKNLPYIIKHRGISELKNLFKNKPAIIICSAPTVTKLLPQLLNEKIRSKIIIIAVAQMLRPLLAFGIKPDFICTVDYGEINYEHFDNLWYVKDIPLVMLNRTYAPIIEKWQGAKFIVTGFNPAPKDTVVEMLNAKGQLEQGGSVGHMAIGLGIHLGCNPIIHIGFDCAYDMGNKLSHNELGDANGKININEEGNIDWNVTDPNSILKKDNHKMGNVVYLQGYFNNPVPTNQGLASFVTAMENIFNSYPKIKFINACEGGAKKKYCEQMSLKKTLKDFCKKDINKKVLNKYLTLLPNYEKDIKEAERRLSCEIKLFEDEIVSCDKAIRPLNRMQKANNKLLKELLMENEIFAIEAQEIAKQSNLLSLHIYKTSREIHSRELKVNGKTKHLLKDKSDLETRIKRSKMILEAAKVSANILKNIYGDVLCHLGNMTSDSIIRQASIIHNSELDIKIKPETWDKLIENGNWARPLLESKYCLDNNWCDVYNGKFFKTWEECSYLKQKCIDEGLNRFDLTNEIEYNKYIELSKESGLKKDFKLSLKHLQKAIKIFPDRLEAIWGIATIYNYNNKINQSIKYYELLCKKQPNNKRFKFELGQVWLKKDIQKGIKIINEVMNETNEFDSFYIRLAELENGMKNNKLAKEYINKYLTIYPHSIDGQKLLKIINS